MRIMNWKKGWWCGKIQIVFLFLAVANGKRRMEKKTRDTRGKTTRNTRRMGLEGGEEIEEEGGEVNKKKDKEK